MKILVLSFYFSPDLCAGSFRATGLVKALTEKMAGEGTIDVITTKPNRYSSYKLGSYDSIAFSGVSVERVKIPSHKGGVVDQAISFFYFYREVLRIIKNKEYDLVVATSSRLLTAFLASRVASKLKCKLYLDIRDIFLDTVVSVFPKGLVFFVYPILKFIENKTFRRSNKINLVSKGFESYFFKWKDKNLTYHTNGIDKEFLNFNRASNIHSNDMESKINILYAGNIGQGQGLELIIPKLSSSLSSKYTITVIGDGGRKGALESELKLLNSKNVKLLPPCSRSEVVEHYSKADVLFLHLNKCAAFEKVLPSKIFEYAATGKPIVAGVSGYSNDFISKEIPGSYLFEPCNVQQALLKIEEVDIRYFERNEFVEKYNRSYIMSRMADDILNLI